MIEFNNMATYFDVSDYSYFFLLNLYFNGVYGGVKK